MQVQSYRELQVWQLAMDLVTLIYQHTAKFPKEETYGLTSQLRRAAVSIPSNIAEGQGRMTTGEFLNQLSVARGSIMEVQTQVEIARRLKFLPETETTVLLDLATRVAQMTNALIGALKRKS
jgi:four helix bundle protein